MHLHSRFVSSAVLLCIATACGSIRVHAQEQGGDAAQIDEIIVTAQRREQRLQDVPVSVSVVSGVALERGNIRTLEDLANHMPNVNIAVGIQADFLNIRGVGSGNNAGFEQSVATFVDGVYRARSRTTRAALFDVERVEVLRGPQTTFFGANAIAGALNISTRRPGREFEYNASTLYAFEDSERNFEAGVTIPASDTLSFRVAGRISGMEGYVDNNLNGYGPNNSSQQARASLRWQPSENFRSDFRLDGGRSRTMTAYPYELIGCPAPAPFATPATSTCGRALAFAATTGIPLDDELNYHSDSPPSFANYDFAEAALTNELQVGSASLTSITSFFTHYYHARIQQVPMPIVSPISQGLDGFPAQQTEKNHQFSQELRFQSETGGTFEYMVGGYVAASKVEYESFFGFFFNAFGAVPAIAATGTTAETQLTGKPQMEVSDRTLSGFASATIRPFEDFRINLGARFSTIRKKASREENTFGTTSGNLDPRTYVRLPVVTQDVIATVIGTDLFQFPEPRRTDDKFMPSLGIQYDLTDDIMAYATWSRGFKAGGYNFASRALTFNPETVDAYEVGVKGTFLERRLSVNADVFLSDYQDLQESTIVFSGGVPFSIVGNAAESRAKGAELSATLRLTDHVSISSDVAYLDSKYVSYPGGACTILGSVTGCVVQDMSGKRRSYSPEFSGNLGVSFVFPFGENEFRADPSLYYSARYFQNASADPLIQQGGYGKLDLRFSYGPADRRWEIALVGKNVNDKLTSGYRQTITGTTGPLLAIADRPRSVALQFSVKN